MRSSTEQIISLVNPNNLNELLVTYSPKLKDKVFCLGFQTELFLTALRLKKIPCINYLFIEVLKKNLDMGLEESTRIKIVCIGLDFLSLWVKENDKIKEYLQGHQMLAFVDKLFKEIEKLGTLDGNLQLVIMPKLVKFVKEYNQNKSHFQSPEDLNLVDDIIIRLSMLCFKFIKAGSHNYSKIVKILLLTSETSGASGSRGFRLVINLIFNKSYLEAIKILKSLRLALNVRKEKVANARINLWLSMLYLLINDKNNFEISLIKAADQLKQEAKTEELCNKDILNNCTSCFQDNHSEGFHPFFLLMDYYLNAIYFIGKNRENCAKMLSSYLSDIRGFLDECIPLKESINKTLANNHPIITDPFKLNDLKKLSKLKVSINNMLEKAFIHNSNLIEKLREEIDCLVYFGMILSKFSSVDSHSINFDL